MILLGSFLHHEELAEILGRALEDRLFPEDARRLKLLINLNSFAIRSYSTLFATELFREIFGSGVGTVAATEKSVMKDLIVGNPHYLNPRIIELIDGYQRFPEDYYRETPYDGMLFTTGDPPRYQGSRRIKRIRRIAEKSARRLIDYIYEQIRQRADELAAERARHLGIPKERLVTPEAEMAAEFAHAERRVLKSIRDDLFVAAMPYFHIDDVMGIRIVVTEESARLFDDYLASRPDLSIVDEKRFSGDFRGRNMVVAYRLPTDAMLAELPDDVFCANMVSRGVAASGSEIHALYRKFVTSAEGYVRFEILLIDYEQLLESEIGRSMHEDHVRAQRDAQVYTGRLAQNTEALMYFLFAFALSNRGDFGEMPIKLRGTYLPDYFERVQRRLYGLPSGALSLTM